ncbi:hypothetical protein, partial [Burkholderia pseudomallei]|uniref:hypothetical protein n=1 Tax=Burkholderia pseudomallei TaxID=28450 RepID=UPI001A8D3C1D
ACTLHESLTLAQNYLSKSNLFVSHDNMTNLSYLNLPRSGDSQARNVTRIIPMGTKHTHNI